MLIPPCEWSYRVEKSGFGTQLRSRIRSFTPRPSNGELRTTYSFRNSGARTLQNLGRMAGNAILYKVLYEPTPTALFCFSCQTGDGCEVRGGDANGLDTGTECVRTLCIARTMGYGTR